MIWTCVLYRGTIPLFHNQVAHAVFVNRWVRPLHVTYGESEPGKAVRTNELETANVLVVGHISFYKSSVGISTNLGQFHLTHP